MDPISIVAGIAGAIASLIGTGVSYFSQKNTNKENRDYATQMTTAQWERDDTSLQRQVEDAKKAGLSPLAVTGTLNTSSPLNYVAQAPQMNMSSLAALTSSFMNNATTQHEGEANRKSSSESLDKQLTYNLYSLQKTIQKDKDLQQDQFAHDLVVLGKQLTYQYDVLNEQSQSHAQDLDSDRLKQLSEQSMETYKSITDSIGMAPRTEYVSDLKTYTEMYNSFMVKYNNFLQDWKGVDEGYITQSSTSEGMSSSVMKTGVQFSTQSGKTYENKGTLLHDMFSTYFSDAVFPILINDTVSSSSNYSYKQ